MESLAWDEVVPISLWYVRCYQNPVSLNDKRFLFLIVLWAGWPFLLVLQCSAGLGSQLAAWL